jgi:sulfate adenylyltransferase
MLVDPHGGRLVDRFVGEPQVLALRERARSLPGIELDARELADLELIATGALSPLAGFLGSSDYRSVLERMRLADGTVWPLPITLAVAEKTRLGLEPGGEAALRDDTGRLWGSIEISEIFERDPLVEARMVYRTVDPAHPGVGYLLRRPRWLVAGRVHVLDLPADMPFARRRLTPARLREEIRGRGWQRVAGFQTRNPIHRAHEHLTKLALEFTDGLVIHALVGETKGDDVPAAVRFQSYEILLENYYPRHRTLLAAFPAAMRYAGPREAIFHALARKNYGITHFIVGRDHAGVGGFYEPYEAQDIFDRFDPAELGVTPLKLDAVFFCQPCDGLASPRTCPHDGRRSTPLSGSRVRELLRSGSQLPRQFTRPEIAEVLREHYARGGNGHGETGQESDQAASAAQRRDPTPAVELAVTARSARSAGFILWLTGLSGAGKSTLASALRQRLQAERAVEILDGDEVRAHLSKELGFSKEDRNTNVRRIGYVARLLARNGVAVIAAAISPYAQTRREVRQQAAEEGIPFVEVFAHAELEALIRRDVKGLYGKALAGEIPHFTGVSDPYEPPEKPEVLVRTDLEPVEETVEKILAALRRLGLYEPVGPEAEAVA